MVRKIVSLMILLVGASVFGQGSPGVIAPIYTKTGDTLVILATSGDSIMMYDSSAATVVRLRGTNSYWVIPSDTLITTILKASDVVVSPSIQIGQGGGGGSLVFDNFASSAVVYSLTGDGMQVVSGYLSAVLGSTVEGSEITNQTIKKVDIDTTIAMVYASIYRGTSAVSDSLHPTKYYVDHNLFGYSVTGTPTGGQVPVYNSGSGQWSFGSGGGGSGDDIAFDMTLSNSDYTLGATTYTGGYINTSTVWMRGDTGLNIVKSGQHPGDTMLLTPDWARVQRNDGTQSIRTFRTTSGDTLLVMQDSSIYTKMTTSNTGGWKFEAPVHVDNNLVFDNSNRVMSGLFALQGKDDALSLYISDSSSVGIQTAVTNKPTYFGSSTNWTIHADTIRGANGQILGIKYIYADTASVLRELMRAGQFGIVTSTDTALLYTRDTTNDTTTVRAVGKLKFTADAGLTEMDSVALHGRLRMYDGTNKSRIDSASGISADTLKTLPGGFLTLQGGTSGRIRMKSAATTTSYDITWPNAQGAAGTVPQNDGSGGLTWSASAGGGNGSADFDSTGSLDSNILKGAGGTILLDVHKNSTPSVVIGKGTTMTSLIIGGNNSGVTAVDTAALIYNNLYFGNQVNKGTRIDSTFVMDQLKQHRYYFTPTDFYGSPEAYAVRYTFTSWNEADTTGTFPNSMYKRNALFYTRDTNGVNTLPYNFTWVAPSRDSLFSTVYNIKTGFTQADSSSLYAAALYVNETKVDTLTPQKAVTSFTVDSLDWTNRAIAQGDVVTVLLWIKLNPTATSKKRFDLKDMYLNMRRY